MVCGFGSFGFCCAWCVVWSRAVVVVVCCCGVVWCCVVLVLLCLWWFVCVRVFVLLSCYGNVLICVDVDLI